MKRFTKARSYPLRKESRTIPVHGVGDDANKYFRCWNCGFICKVGRDSLGDANSRSGHGLTTYSSKSYTGTGDQVTDELARVSVLGGVVQSHVALKLWADGTPEPIRHDFKSNIVSGCPFCGTRNWRGDY